MTQLPPVIKTVAIYREIPRDLKTPCERTPWVRSDVKTDVDLMNRVNVEKARADCNEAKLLGIDGIDQPGPVLPVPDTSATPLVPAP